jgi:hypothetical protein
MKNASILGLGLGLALTGCIGFEDAPDTDTVAKKGEECPSWGCGMNSPIMKQYGFYWLRTNGLPNDEGFTLDRLEQDTVAYKLIVEHGRIIAINDQGDIQGPALAGAILHIGHNGDPAFAIRISEVQSTSFWATRPDGSVPTLETYRFHWSPAEYGSTKYEWQDLCVGMTGEGDHLAGSTYNSVVYEGDVYDAEKKLVLDELDTERFNLGCAGSTLAKLYLTGYAHPAEVEGLTSKRHERQAMLKLLTGDYCGTGKPFTVGGTPLQWADPRGSMKPTDTSTLEALWNENGAVCLEKPRLQVNKSELGVATFGEEIETAIKDECQRPPTCAEALLDPGATYFVSANPPPY